MASEMWSAVVNAAGVSIRNPGGEYTALPQGAYKVKIVETKEHKSEKGLSILVQTQVTEGPNAGEQARVYLGLDFSKDGVKKSWRAALLSIGFAAEQVDSGDMQVGPSTFENASAFLYVKHRQKGDKTEVNHDFITESQFLSYTEQKDAPQVDVVVSAPVKAAIAAPAAPAAKAAAAAPAVSVTVPTPAGGAVNRLRNLTGGK
jgi:hypothetical protein